MKRISTSSLFLQLYKMKLATAGVVCYTAVISVSGEELCVTTLITAAQQTTAGEMALIVTDRIKSKQILHSVIIRNLKVFLILKSFRSKDLACTNEKKSQSAQRASNSDAGVMLPQKILQFDVISMEFLSLRCRRSSWRNVPSDEEQGETAVFAGQPKDN